MTALRTIIRFWERRAIKMSSYIGWRGAWRNPCIHNKMWLRFSNEMMDHRENDPREKTKSPPAGQTKNSACIKPSRDRKELKAIPYP